MAVDPNDPDLLAVATAYRRARIAGKTDHTAYGAAVAAYRKRHPNLSDDEVETKVRKLMRDAYDTYGQSAMIGEIDYDAGGWRPGRTGGPEAD